MKRKLYKPALLALAIMATSCDSKEVEKPITEVKAKNTMENKTIESPTGLKYVILQEAQEGAKSPKKGQRVTVHYTGWLDNDGELGKKFDSSVDRGQAFSFNVGSGQVIKGWDEGVLSMKVGEKRRLIIPSELGYGNAGAGGIIPGGATLIFDVELLS